jgi:hypothetical protein
MKHKSPSFEGDFCSVEVLAGVVLLVSSSPDRFEQLTANGKIINTTKATVWRAGSLENFTVFCSKEVIFIKESVGGGRFS